MSALDRELLAERTATVQGPADLRAFLAVLRDRL